MPPLKYAWKESTTPTPVAMQMKTNVASRSLTAPEIIFLISGIFPLVPGAGIYWTAYYLVSDQMSLALASGSGAFKTCLAMVLGIAVIHELPQWIFSGRRIGGKAK